MILKLKSKGKSVEILQEFLGLSDDGIFGHQTELAVKRYQRRHQLSVDGIVGPKTWDHMGLATTDNSEQYYTTVDGLLINRHHLPIGEYNMGGGEKEYIFLHHTSGWHNPYRQIDIWGRDNRGKVGTEFVVGGQSVKGDNQKYNGRVVQAFPDGGYGWHLGNVGSRYMHTNSVGVELCNFGYIVNGTTYVGTPINNNQLVTLKQEFRGYRDWHRYSNEQIESTRLLLLYVAERDSIDLREGLPSLIREKGLKGFEFDQRAYLGKIRGLLSHSNVRKDKTDIFPQQEMVDMLLSL